MDLLSHKTGGLMKMKMKPSKKKASKPKKKKPMKKVKSGY